jgi:hypothetical protein
MKAKLGLGLGTYVMGKPKSYSCQWKKAKFWTSPWVEGIFPKDCRAKDIQKIKTKKLFSSGDS